MYINNWGFFFYMQSLLNFIILLSFYSQSKTSDGFTVI